MYNDCGRKHRYNGYKVFALKKNGFVFEKKCFQESNLGLNDKMTQTQKDIVCYASFFFALKVRRSTFFKNEAIDGYSKFAVIQIQTALDTFGGILPEMIGRVCMCPDESFTISGSHNFARRSTFQNVGQKELVPYRRTEIGIRNVDGELKSATE